ncbi:MAG: hypothetical protein FWG19_03165, partial [Methanomassiliicoccaceae archaeon]|nr:hypothetical protein [Methanomassiliicoccaceae archaeon]
LTYTWTGGATGTAFTPALGTPVTCTVTAGGATGNISGTVTVYRVTSGVTVTNGSTGTFSIAAAYGKAGDIVICSHNAGNSGGVTFSNGTNPVTLSGGNTSYAISAADSISGVITITATFAAPADPRSGGDGDEGGSNMLIIAVAAAAAVVMICAAVYFFVLRKP